MSDLQWGQAASGWQLSVSMDEDEVPWDHPVRITVALKNSAEQPQELTATSKWAAYEFQVTNDEGDVPRTLFGQRIRTSRLEERSMLTRMAPNETVVSEVPLSRVFDLSEKDRYTVTVSRQVYDAQKGQMVQVVSNKLTFEIVEQ